MRSAMRAMIHAVAKFLLWAPARIWEGPTQSYRSANCAVLLALEISSRRLQSSAPDSVQALTQPGFRGPIERRDVMHLHDRRVRQHGPRPGLLVRYNQTILILAAVAYRAAAAVASNSNGHYVLEKYPCGEMVSTAPRIPGLHIVFSIVLAMNGVVPTARVLHRPILARSRHRLCATRVVASLATRAPVLQVERDNRGQSVQTFFHRHYQSVRNHPIVGVIAE